MIRILIAAALLASPAATATADQPEQNLSRWKANMSRHQQVLMKGLPAPYDRIKDPVPDTEGKLRRGAALFDRHCSSCHGWSGSGGGSEGFFLVSGARGARMALAGAEGAGPPLTSMEHIEGGRRSIPNAGVQAEPTGEECGPLAFYLRSDMPTPVPNTAVDRPPGVRDRAGMAQPLLRQN